jgi:hypothetical protein
VSSRSIWFQGKSWAMVFARTPETRMALWREGWEDITDRWMARDWWNDPWLVGRERPFLSVTGTDRTVLTALLQRARVGEGWVSSETVVKDIGDVPKAEVEASLSALLKGNYLVRARETDLWAADARTRRAARIPDVVAPGEESTTPPM